MLDFKRNIMITINKILGTLTIIIIILFTGKCMYNYINKNDNIHKTKFKISDYQTNIELILQPIIITNFCGSENHLR